MKQAAKLSRRKTLTLTLGALSAPALPACKPRAAPQNAEQDTEQAVSQAIKQGTKQAAPLKPGRLTERTIRAPIPVQNYSRKYTAPKGKFDIETLTYKAVQRQYHVYKPVRPPRAVLLLLHGSNRNGASLVDKWKRLADTHSILLIAPDSANKAGWSARNDPAGFMQAVLDHAKQKYRAPNNAPTYGFGHSAGAIKMTVLSITNPDMFRAISVHAGYISAQNAQVSKNYTTPKVPLAHFLGSQDHIFNLKDARQSAKTLTDYGQDVDLVTIADHTHWYYDIAEFVNAKAWRFMSGIKAPI